MTKAITKNSKKGFTLVELVIVIAILAILAAIAIPVVNSIINTASKNGALSNAETIELAVKECQADIAAKNDEVYADAAGANHGNITIATVATEKAIQEAFEMVTYNGADYTVYWVTADDKCVFLTPAAGGAGLTDLDGNSYATGDVQQLADASGIVASPPAIDNL